MGIFFRIISFLYLLDVKIIILLVEAIATGVTPQNQGATGSGVVVVVEALGEVHPLVKETGLVLTPSLYSFRCNCHVENFFSCGNVNFAFRKECHKCGTPKPGGPPGSGGGGRSNDGRPGDWICS